MANVLILGGRAPVALDLARRFRHHGWQVHVADSIACRLSGWSRATSTTIPLASPRHAPAAFVAGLSEAIRKHAIDLVVPTCEEVFYLSRHRSSLPGQVRILADDFDKLQQLHSKWHFLALAADCGIPVPQSGRVQTIAEARAWASDAPVVLKPEFSRFGVHVQCHPDGLPAQAPELASIGPWIAQRHLSGKELCSYAIADRGRLLAHAVYQPRYKLRAGASYYFDPTCLDAACVEAIRGYVAALADKLTFTGQLSFDWIQGADGTITVLECNPRATSGLHLFASCDDIPAALTGNSDGCLEPGHSRPAMISDVMLTAGLANAVGRASVAQWLADYRRADDVVSVPGDRWPMAGALLDIASYSRLALAQRCNLLEATTQDIEWNGEALPPL